MDHAGVDMERAGMIILRYGLVLLLLWIGGLKFTDYEAKGVEPLVANSPFLSWAYHLLGLQGIARLLGIVEIAFGVLIALGPLNPRLSMYGSIGSALMFLITLSLLFTTPGVIAPGYSFPVLSANVGQFLLKDVVLLGGAIWTAGEARRARKRPYPDIHG